MSESKPAANLAAEPEYLYEFDREPVPKSRLLGPGYFAGAYAGEHVAATEFVIGVTFVNWGASVQDIFLGLVVGNLLAVLTWTLVCAPIAVETRLTLYWYLRKIGGPRLSTIYNVANALLYAILAGCMITVSASAVRIPFGIPPQIDWYPTDFRFVLVVLAVGAIVVTLAVLGFQKLATFASVCSPWMFLMFIVGALAVLPELLSGASVHGFFEMAGRVVWTGHTPDGSEPMGFWKVAAFAWICNLGMHGALSDMALFRFARKASYGLFSSFGMFLGHYLAWICAGLMGAGAAILMNRPLVELDAGEVGFQALGWVGALAVVIAGWTTSNPTLYRVGLALQAVTPNWSRAKVTLVAGVVTTLVACFPFVFTGLLDYVAIYGLLISPVGAIVVTEHWIFPRTGLNRYWASGRSLNWPALGSWLLAVALGIALERTGTLHLFYIFLPTYGFAMVSYWYLARLAGAGRAVPAPESRTSPSPATSAPGAGVPQAGRRSLLEWACGATATVCLAVCLWLGLRILQAPPESFQANLGTLHTQLVLPTLLYFVTGTAYASLRRPSGRPAV